MIKKIQTRNLYMGRLPYGSDLLEEMTKICQNEDIRLGKIEALGAVQRASIGFYDQKSRQYQFHQLDRPLEIAGLVGNVSIKDDKPFVHAHITLSDETGRAYGGHLAAGTVVFACEITITVFDGPAFERDFDQETGLPLWTMLET